MSEDKERRRILARVLGMFDDAYGKGLLDSTDKVRLWYAQIGHLNEDAAIATAEACISHHKWQPTISEYLEVSRQVRRQQEANAHQLPREQGEHIKELQDKGILIQRELIKSRTQAKHDHTNGWQGCPVCSKAEAEKNEDECRCCFILDNHGIEAVHFVP